MSDAFAATTAARATLNDPTQTRVDLTHSGDGFAVLVDLYHLLSTYR
jgi:hypothetical protein